MLEPGRNCNIAPMGPDFCACTSISRSHLLLEGPLAPLPSATPSTASIAVRSPIPMKYKVSDRPLGLRTLVVSYE